MVGEMSSTTCNRQWWETFRIVFSFEINRFWKTTNLISFLRSPESLGNWIPSVVVCRNVYDKFWTNSACSLCSAKGTASVALIPTPGSLMLVLIDLIQLSKYTYGDNKLRMIASNVYLRLVHIEWKLLP